MKIKGEKTDALKYQHFAKVTIRPHGEFPIDMLRYDRCTPNRESDSSRIILSTHPHDNEIVVVVRCVSDTSVAPWTVDRWKSFGATIEPITRAQTYDIERQIEENFNPPTGAAKAG